jgi:hypothetical protein
VRLLLGALMLMLVSCGNDEVLSVRQFHLQDTEVSRDYYRSSKENRFVRGEINKRVHGSISAKEREAKKGRYYTVSWDTLKNSSPIRIVFEYRQSRSGAREKKLEETFPPSRQGKTEFQIIGEAYLKGGDVIAWRATLYEGGKPIAVKKSYLWD